MRICIIILCVINDIMEGSCSQPNIRSRNLGESNSKCVYPELISRSRPEGSALPIKKVARDALNHGTS